MKYAIIALGLTVGSLSVAQIAHVEAKLGVPTFFWAERDLSLPIPRAMGLDPVEAARRHLFEHAALYRTSSGTLAEAQLEHVHDTGEGALIVTFSKQVAGIPVFRDAIHVVMDREYRLVAITGYLSPHDGTAHRWNLARTTALAIAFSDLTGIPTGPNQFAETGDAIGDYHYLEQLFLGSVSEHGPLLVRPSRVKSVMFSLPEQLVPAYYVELEVSEPQSTDSRMFSYVVSAADGALLFRHDLTATDSFTYRVWADPSGGYVPYDGPQGTIGTPHPTGLPDGYQAPLPHEPRGVPPNLVTLQNGPISTNDPWLPTLATATRGNNVDAYADRTAPDGFTPLTENPMSLDTRARTTVFNTFDYTYDTAHNPNADASQIQASVTNLFFVNNFLHDWFYDSGFDEQSGNAQHENFQRGGLGRDRLNAEAQDVSGINNANMSTPADGAEPRMQMYIFNGPAVRSFTVNSPPTIAGSYPAGIAGVGPQVFDLTADIHYARDSSGSPLGCVAYAPGTFVGRIALVDLGICTFATKIQNAEAAGAVGFVLANNERPGTVPPGGTPTQPIHIPAFSISLDDAFRIKGELGVGNPVNVRMFREATINRDGTLDNAIVAHEWGHLLSGRLIGNGAGLNNNQGRSLGEGWGDFTALLMLVREEDLELPSNPNFTGVYGMSTYVTPAFTPNNYYFGARRVPYSTDMTKNALTFRHIEDGVPLPTTHPILPFANNAEVHNAGEIWCTMLWDAYVSLLQARERYTFTEAQKRMKHYLVASLKATPNSPTFLEARDALLAAALATDVRDFDLFAKAFAKRGAGIGAVAPPRFSTTHQPTVESFKFGNDVAFVGVELDDDAFYCDRDGILDNDEIGTLTFSLKNTGQGILSSLSARVSSLTPGVTVIGNLPLSFPPIGPFEVVKGTVQVKLTGARSVTQVALKIELDDPSLVVTSGPRSQTVVFTGNWDDAPNASATETAEAASSPWMRVHVPRLAETDWTRQQDPVGNVVWAGPDASGQSDVSLVSPPLDVGGGNFSFTFRHRHSFEFSSNTFWDGGVIEISSDGGRTWTDIGVSANPAYNAMLSTTSGNPLGGRKAYGARNASHPGFDMVTVNLGSAYRSQRVQIRFRIATDEGTGDEGWAIDDIVFTGITNTPFSAQIPDPGVCINRPPIAVASHQTVDERTVVTLDSSQSFDPDGDSMTVTWTYLRGPDGPDVKIFNGSFTAPEVKKDTQLTFRLTLSDGQLVSHGAISTVLVRHVNRKPTASAGSALDVAEREIVVLDGSHSFDIDDDPITYRWTQESGPKVDLGAEATATPSFETPEVPAGTTETLRFFLVVSDAKIESDPSFVEVTIHHVNRPPTVAIERIFSTVDERSPVTLMAMASDPDDANAVLAYHWSVEGGPSELVHDSISRTWSFTAPEVQSNTHMTFKVVVTDDDPNPLSAEATVSFQVKQVNRAPFVNAGADLTAPPNVAVALNASETRDPDGDALTYAWRQVSGHKAAISNSTSAMPTIHTPDVAGELVFELLASDGVASGLDTVKLAVSGARSGACGCSAGESGALGFGALLLLVGLRLFGRKRVL